MNEIYGIELQIYRPNGTSSWTRCECLGVVTPNDEMVESNLTDRDGLIELAGGILRRVSYEIDLHQYRDNADRAFFYNAYINRTTVELLIGDLPIDDDDMIGIRGPFRVLKAPSDASLEEKSVRKLLIKPTKDSLIPFTDITGPYVGLPTDTT
jgi:hypothetical protein